MAGTTSSRKYGKRTTRSKAERLFAELPQSPLRRKPEVQVDDKSVAELTENLSVIKISAEQVSSCIPVEVIEEKEEDNEHLKSEDPPVSDACPQESIQEVVETETLQPGTKDYQQFVAEINRESHVEGPALDEGDVGNVSLRMLTWEDICPPGDQITKIAEASFAEVYRVSNERGTSIIKVMRLESPLKAQTKAQVRSGLVDEEPRSGEDVEGELQISEWLADIPGFVVYKERYVVQGKAPRQLIETHQAFQKKLKKQDPGRAQFYPSPTRYLPDTKFLVVELGDAGKALEDWELTSMDQLWDVFFLEAIALARAEDVAMFEHRDLHEGNLCLKQVSPPRKRHPNSSGYFGYSGLEITILDYGLSRAEDLSIDYAKPVAYDLEKDLSLFTSTHAPQCKVYRQMRSFLLRADRICLPPEKHDNAYAKGIDGPISWDAYAPYTNVLWLAYLYEYLVNNFAGSKKELNDFKKLTAEMWGYLNPEAKSNVPCFGSAEDIVGFAVEAGWVREDQLMELGNSILDKEDSIIISKAEDDVEDASVRRSPRRKQ
ncbi:unnamed protein product [Clonostachys byssicola]|uniref:non-specific serine/threonine protein kinase n=1 Tax=Clonostachys byssicola TaxID=160290 RepID=A0A9N9U3J9_9HYPO|nr:unnamed protein product [Clonostachys byssicola]